MFDIATGYDKAAIMRRAWELAKGRANGQPIAHATFAAWLRIAWQEAKKLKNAAKPYQPLTVADRLIILENKTRWTEADYSKASELRRQVRAA